MSLRTLLSLIRSSAHAVAPSTLVDHIGNSGIVAEGLNKLVAYGFIKRQERGRNAGKYYTWDAARLIIDNMDNCGAVYNSIKASPTSLQLVANPTLDALLMMSAVKQHNRKRGYYFTNPETRGFYTELFQSIVVPATSTNVGEELSRLFSNSDTDDDQGVPPLSDSEILQLRVILSDRFVPLVTANSTGSTFDTEPCDCGNCHEDEDEDEQDLSNLEAEQDLLHNAQSLGAIKPGVLALLRLSPNGVSLSMIHGALNSLFAENMVKQDSRDSNNDYTQQRYFVRKPKRDAADAVIVQAIINNESIVAKLDETAE